MPAERAVDGREPSNDATLAQIRLELGQPDVRTRFDQPAQIPLMRRQAANDARQGGPGRACRR
jgi:hypothetical protein